MKKYKWYEYVCATLGLLAYWAIVYTSNEEHNPVMVVFYSFLVFMWTLMLTKLRVSFKE